MFLLSTQINQRFTSRCLFQSGITALFAGIAQPGQSASALFLNSSLQGSGALLHMEGTW
jgi:hypothetical protein